MPALYCYVRRNSMKKVMKRLIALVVSVCLSCSLIPVSLAAGESFHFYYEFDQDKYQVGDTVNVKVMVERKDSDEDFDLYSYSLNALFKEANLEFVGSKATLSDQFRITDTTTKWNAGYRYVVLSYNGLGSHIDGCKSKTEIATLTFKAKAKVNGLVMDMLLPSIGVEPGPTIEPTGAGGNTIIGEPDAPTYSITFNRGTAPADSVTDPTMDAQAENSQFTLPQNPYNWDNHTFLGWSDGKATYQPNDIYTMPAENVTFTAQWKQDKYTMSFQGGEGTTGEAPQSEMKEPNTVISMYNQGTLKKDGYNFVGWAYNGTTYKPGETFTMPENDVTFTAVWQENAKPNPSPGGSGSGSGGVTSYPVTVNSPANGTVAADKKSAVSGATVTITATPETGYKVGTVTVKDKNGKIIAATEKDGKYSFQMPASAVSVDVTFVKDGQSSVGDCPKDSTCPVDPFKDTANNAWWHDGIHYCVQQGLMNGVASDQFAPNGTTTRAMIVTILWRMEGSPATSYGMSFTDVPAGQWYTEAIRWAQSTGVVTGYDAKTFGPNDNVTREQLAAILYRYTAHKGGDVSKRSTLAQFTDVNQISSWALENIQWANAVGMVNGRTDTTIVPKGNATRAEAASMIQRFCQNVLKL